jgi:hypothetical protein
MVYNTTRAGVVDLTILFKRGLEAQSIYVPSKQRLLRLLNAKRCEFCLCPWQNNGIKEYGLFLCEECETLQLLVRTPSEVLLVHRGVKEVMFTDHRTVRGSYDANELLQDTIRTGVNKSELCGPILSLRAIEYICENEMTVDEYLLERKESVPDPILVRKLMEAMHSASETRQRPVTDTWEVQEERTRVSSVITPVLDLVHDRWKRYTSYGFAPGNNARPMFDTI